MDEATNQNQETQAQETQETTPRTYTEEEVRELLQKEGDKRVSEAMKKAERKSQAKIKEATKLAQMNEEQKFQYELEQREKAIEAKEKELALAENKATASQVLADRGLSAKLVDMVVAEDADEMMDNINLLDSAFKASVKAEVEKRLASKTPKKNLPLDTHITQEQFRAMPLSQQAELYKTNPDLYKQLSGRG
ncbi:DUF4355 domain-containing protein [Thermophilibacter provencensis]|uniref:DUF4355 domain-containing protein n=1 Tax=Thermophilibacter provencensis TaxID=1852386 RepID=UPI0023528089|nr:DUF4355 domain-containing protein [Thermophilibacter provencensis]